jgi:adenylate cyclase
MTWFKAFRIRNSMLFSTMVANMIGVSVVLFLSNRPLWLPEPDLVALSDHISSFFLPCAFFVPAILILIYEKPIRFYAKRVFLGLPVSEEATLKARKKLLNEPFFLIALSFGVWLVAAFLYSGTFWLYGARSEVTQNAFLLSLYTGLITSTVAFFVFEFVMQRRVVPFYFPKGRLSAVPGTLRLRIQTRLLAFFFASSLIPLLIILNDIREAHYFVEDPMVALERLQATVPSAIVVFLATAVWLTFLVSSNLTKPLQEIIRVLKEIRNGVFDHQVEVTSNDEIGYTGDVINEMTEGLKERDFIKETFGKYVTKEIRDEILSGKVPLDGELKEVSVLFSDLRDFTPMVEAMPPKEVVKIINGYFREMEEAIRKNQGLVLQYIGDEIEAVFGAPISIENHALRAVEAALEMKRRLKAVNDDLASKGYPALAHGIGIHTGKVLAANIGSPDRLSYALVGDTVNLASRLQGLNKELGTDILLSAATRSRINGSFSFREWPATKVKGKREEVKIFSIA